MKYYILSLCFIGLLLCGCALNYKTQKHNIVLSDEQLQIIWHNHLTDLTNLNAWKLSAQVQVKTPTEYAKFFIKWKQKNNHYHCDITGPLAVSIAKITGKENYIYLVLAKQNLTSENPNSLIQEITGFYIPIEAIAFWIKGMPNVNFLAEQSLNRTGQIYKLNQLGYQIKYTDYKRYKSYMLPSRIQITNSTVSISIIINKWNL